MEDRSDASPGEQVLALLASSSHLAPPEALPALVADAVAVLGGRETHLRIVDHAQRELVPIGEGEAFSVDATVAGKAFRQIAAQQVEGEGTGERRVWVPVLDGIERLGVIGATFPAVDEVLLDRLGHLASFVGELIVSRTRVGDALQRVARGQEMGLAAEIQWSLMPPLTAGTTQVTIAAMLEPAYEVGGDLVDYALGAHLVRFGVLDAMGHGVGASTISAVAVGAYRNARRREADLPGQAYAIETAVAEQFGEQFFVTAVLAELDPRDGQLRWLSAGHPDPLLLRGGRVVLPLEGEGGAPLGVGLNSGPEAFPVHELRLEPGDRLLAFTDGVIEAQTPDGEQFGVDRLAEFVVRAGASAEPLPETMRRLSRAVIEHQQGDLRDDATQVLVEWHGPGGIDHALS